MILLFTVYYYEARPCIFEIWLNPQTRLPSCLPCHLETSSYNVIFCEKAGFQFRLGWWKGHSRLFKRENEFLEKHAYSSRWLDRRIYFPSLLSAIRIDDGGPFVGFNAGQWYRGNDENRISVSDNNHWSYPSRIYRFTLGICGARNIFNNSMSRWNGLTRVIPRDGDIKREFFPIRSFYFHLY